MRNNWVRAFGTAIGRRIAPIRRVMDRITKLEQDKAALEREKCDQIAFANRTAAGTGEFACTVCREEYALSPFERRTDVNGTIFDLWVCLKCHAILNATHLRAVRQGNDFLDMQAGSSDEFYAIDDAFLAGVPAAIAADGFMGFLFQQYPACPRGVALDFGAGRGISAGAAANFFDRVYAADLTLNALRQVHAVIPQREKVIMTDDYYSIPENFDLIFFSHTLEHLTNMRDILDDLVGRLNPGGALFFQVPLLKKEYLVCVHFTFFTEACCRAMALEFGLDLLGVWYGHELDFLTCIMVKSISPLSPAS
jgi:2-polyprenyl-3-methyl-5-hydroxy-6-metoxy-1,4-benzoquinol methylase